MLLCSTGRILLKLLKHGLQVTKSWIYLLQEMKCLSSHRNMLFLCKFDHALVVEHFGKVSHLKGKRKSNCCQKF